eukprot:139830-Chlamydomonas_euryale.AAC.2
MSVQLACERPSNVTSTHPHANLSPPRCCAVPPRMCWADRHTGQRVAVRRVQCFVAGYWGHAERRAALPAVAAPPCRSAGTAGASLAVTFKGHTSGMLRASHAGGWRPSGVVVHPMAAQWLPK